MFGHTVEFHTFNIHQVAQVMESKIKRMTETYTSGTEALREFADALQMKASSDMQQMNSMILSEATEVTNVLRP